MIESFAFDDHLVIIPRHFDTALGGLCKTQNNNSMKKVVMTANVSPAEDGTKTVSLSGAEGSIGLSGIAGDDNTFEDGKVYELNFTAVSEEVAVEQKAAEGAYGSAAQ